jgi:NADPH-dependent ferric siderophore reductase
MTATTSPRSVERVRHVLKARRITVLRTERLTPHIVRVTFGSPELHDFGTASFDDHVKLMLPRVPGQPVVLPVFSGDGPRLPEGAERPLMRDYTPRRFDAAAGELDIEFALHGDGPAAAWAAQAAPGQEVGIGGPRGSTIFPLDYDWHLLVGDETSLPAIARRLEELPAGAPVVAIVEVGDLADRRELSTRASLQVQWVSPSGEGDDSALAKAVQAWTRPEGEGYAWAAGEAHDIAAVRRVLVGPHGLDKNHVRAAAYWKRGAAGHHESLDG